MMRNIILCTLLVLFLIGCSRKSAPVGDPNGNIPVVRADSTQILKKEAFVVLDGKVKVTAKYNPQEMVIELTVAAEGSPAYVVATAPTIGMVDKEDLPAAAQRIYATTGWKDKYLFIRNECGGGNAWNGNTDCVFMMLEGKLHHLGDMTEWAFDSLGSGYQNGIFRYLFDKFEFNDFTSHADAPGIRVSLRENLGKFVVDTALTWKEYEVDYTAQLAELKTKGKEIDDLTIALKLLEMALTTKYCNRTAELHEVLDLTEKMVKGKNLKMIQAMLAEIVPGEMPVRKSTAVRFAAQATAEN